MSHLATVTDLQGFRERKYQPKERYLSGYAELREALLNRGLRRSERSLQRDVRAGLPVALRFSASGRCLFVLDDVVDWYRRRLK